MEAEEYRLKGATKVLIPAKRAKQLRLAQKVVSTAVNPDSGELIPWTARMSSFLPLNMPISFGLIIAPPQNLNTIVWQIIEQTYSAQCNYGNRNASSKNTTSAILKSYILACIASVGVGLVSRALVAKYTRTMSAGAALMMFNSVTSLMAISTASFLNVFFMRFSEFKRGISVFDPEDLSRPIALSKSAARKAVLRTCKSRQFSAISLLIPAILQFGLERLGIMPLHRFGRTVVQMSLLFIQLFVAIPMGLSLYPQFGKLALRDFKNDSAEVIATLENYRNSKGEKIEFYQYNKGL